MPETVETVNRLLIAVERLRRERDELRSERDNLQRDFDFLKVESRFAIESLRNCVVFSINGTPGTPVTSSR